MKKESKERKEKKDKKEKKINNVNVNKKVFSKINKSKVNNSHYKVTLNYSQMTKYLK